MSTKKQLEEISAALNNASKLHKEQSGKLKAMAGKMKDDAKLEQKRRYSKSRRNTNKLVRVKTGPSVGEKIVDAFTKKKPQATPTTNNPKEMATDTTIGATVEPMDTSQFYAKIPQSRKVLHQVSTGQQAGVGPMGNFPTAPGYVPPMPPPPAPSQPGMPMNPNQQVPPVPQDKEMPTGKEGRGIRMLSDDVQRKMGYDPLSQERKQEMKGRKLNDFEKAAEFNKYAMQKGISPNFDSIQAADTTEYKQQHLDAMKKFYSNPDNVRMMNREQEKYFKNK